MEFRELKTFQVVASLLSFKNAGNVLHLAQSTISSQIRSLENSLGKELFFRTGKTISLTPAGVKLLDYTQRLINIEKEIKSVVGNLDEKQGLLTIKTPQSISTYYFPNWMNEFQLLFPKIGFDIDWCTSYNLIDILNSGTIDLAFLITDNFEDKNLETEELSKIKLVLAVHSGHELLKKKEISVKDLNDRTLILAKSDCNYHKILEKRLIHSDVRPEKIIEINNLNAIKRLLILGYGISFLPEMVIAYELKKGLISTLVCTDIDSNAKLMMIWSKEKHISEPLNAFMIMVRKIMWNSSNGM